MASHPSSVLTSTANRSVASLRCSGGGWIVQGQRRLQAPRSAILGSRTSRHGAQPPPSLAPRSPHILQQHVGPFPAAVAARLSPRALRGSGEAKRKCMGLGIERGWQRMRKT